MNFEKYELMHDAGIEPTPACITAHQNGLDIETCAKMLMAVYQLSKAKANEISIVACGAVKPLDNASD